jgi:hypothetical protein
VRAINDFQLLFLDDPGEGVDEEQSSPFSIWSIELEDGIVILYCDYRQGQDELMCKARNTAVLIYAMA